jgi:hypothetical protein
LVGGPPYPGPDRAGVEHVRVGGGDADGEQACVESDSIDADAVTVDRRDEACGGCPVWAVSFERIACVECM